MAIPLVNIINRNGRPGRVPATYPPLVQGHLRRADDQTPVVEQDEQGQPQMPAGNASTQTWREYANSRPDSGLTRDEVEALTRDELVAHFTEEN